MIQQALLNYCDTSMNTSGANREAKWLSLEATILLSLLITLYEIIMFDVLNASSHHSWSMVHRILTISAWHDWWGHCMDYYTTIIPLSRGITICKPKWHDKMRDYTEEKWTTSPYTCQCVLGLLNNCSAGRKHNKV